MKIAGRIDFLRNCPEVSCDLPAEISDDIRIERPAAPYLEWYRDYLDKGGPELTELKPWYESKLVAVEIAPGNSTHNMQPLSSADWKYLVVASSGNGLGVHEFFVVANLLFPVLWPVAHLTTTEPFGQGKLAGWGRDPLESTAKLFLPPLELQDELFGDENVAALREALADYRALNRTRFPDILRASQLLYDLRTISRFSQLLVLGKFSVLEMLLTHSPKLQGNDDSLSHQIRTKIALIDERLSARLDYTPFLGSTPSQVWSALYAYRSAVAHGGSLDFLGKDLKHAKSKQAADEFLSTAVRAILRHALREPVLFESLKPK